MAEQLNTQDVSESGNLRKFGPEERAFLRKHVDKYRSCTSSAQKQSHVGKIAHEFLTQFFPKAVGLERDAVKRMIKTFFSNANRKTTPKVRFWNKAPSRRDISYNMYKEKFLEKVGGMAKFTNAHGRVNLADMRASYAVYEKKDLTAKQRADADAEWKSYKGDKPYPEDIQIEYNRKWAAKFNWAVDHSGHNVFGQYRVSFVIATGEKGHLEVSCSDHIPSFFKGDVKRLEEYLPREFKEMKRTWTKYAQYLQMKIDEAKGDHVADNIPERNAPPGPVDLVLETDSAGFPIMPPINERTATAKYTMQLMRAYINAQYTIARGGERSKAPLKFMTDHPDMLTAGSLPTSITFRDPALLTGSQTREFCRYIHERQTCIPAQDVFRFRYILKYRTGDDTDDPKYNAPLDVTGLTRNGTKKRAPRAKNASGGAAPPVQVNQPAQPSTEGNVSTEGRTTGPSTLQADSAVSPTGMNRPAPMSGATRVPGVQPIHAPGAGPSNGPVSNESASGDTVPKTPAAPPPLRPRPRPIIRSAALTGRAPGMSVVVSPPTIAGHTDTVSGGKTHDITDPINGGTDNSPGRRVPTSHSGGSEQHTPDTSHAECPGEDTRSGDGLPRHPAVKQLSHPTVVSGNSKNSPPEPVAMQGNRRSSRLVAAENSTHVESGKKRGKQGGSLQPNADSKRHKSTHQSKDSIKGAAIKATKK